MPLFKQPTTEIPISTVNSKRDDDYYLKKHQQWRAKRSNMQTSVLQNKNVRLLIAAATMMVVLFWLFASGTPTAHLTQKPDSHIQGTVDPLTCKKSYDGIRPITQYVVMIDAGSSGSRVHVYEFNNCQATPQLVHEEFKMMEPGLSSFKEDAEGAAKSLDQLMDIAVATVPKDVQSCTPVAVKATAGLRLLGEELSNKILGAVRKRLETEYPFPVVEGNGVSIMDGKDEGVYAWITANYLLGNIGSKEKTPTAAVFDLGGGSTQIVFEPTFNVPDRVMTDGDHKYTLDFGGRHFELYQHSHLGYGLNEARKRIHSLVAATQLKGSEAVDGATVINPCLPPGVKASGIKVKVPDTHATGHEGEEGKTREITIEMEGPKEASVAQCRKIAEQILNKEAECKLGPCSFDGVHQPSFLDSFLTDSDMYVFSFFYDRTFPLGMPSSFSLDELKDLTHKVCGGSDHYDSFSAIDGAVDQLKENPHWCLELNFITAILHTGYDIPIHREVKIAKKIKNNELGWCLGASLPLLDQAGWSCKISHSQ